MRPCNQCRTPVENGEQICAACAAYNLEHGLDAPPTVSVAPLDPDSVKPLPLSTNFNALNGMTACCILVSALLGYLLFGLYGLGALLLVGIVLSMMIRTLVI